MVRPDNMVFQDTFDWINSAILADLATEGDENWGNLGMSGNITRYREWHGYFVKMIRPLLTYNI